MIGKIIEHPLVSRNLASPYVNPGYNINYDESFWNKAQEELYQMKIYDDYDKEGFEQ